jgi:hypothetical protein
MPELKGLPSSKLMNRAFLSTDGITIFRGKKQEFKLWKCVIA